MDDHLIPPAQMACQTTIGDLEVQVLLQVFSHLTPREAVTASLVQRHWRQVSHDELYWRAHLMEDWSQAQPLGPDGARCASSWHAYCSWATALGQPQYRSVMKHAVKAWFDIKGWLAGSFPAVLRSLRPGASEAAVAEAGEQLGMPLPAQLAAIYRVHDGQLLRWDANLDEHHKMPCAAAYKQELKARSAAWRAAKQQQQASAATTSTAPRAPGASGSGAAGEAPMGEDGMSATAAAVEVGGRSEPAGPEAVLAAAATAAQQAAAAAAGAVNEQEDQGREQEGEDSGEEEEEEEDEDDAAQQAFPGGGFHQSLFHGVFGGYSFYDHLAVMRMLPLARAVAWTQHLRARGAVRYLQPCLVIAASFNFRKYYCVNLETGELYVNHARSYMPAAPQAAPDQAADGRTGVLGWLCEYGRRLQAGWYEVAAVDPDYPSSKAICLFPRVGPVRVAAVTRGVQVTATTLFAPEISGTSQYLFSYSITFQLLSEEEQQHDIERLKLQAAEPATALGHAPALPQGSQWGTTTPHVIHSCQLMTRHWVIRNAEGQQMDEVMGEGVIGKYPLLTPGCEPFVYQSCTHQGERVGYMEGDFRFVEGSLQARAGPEWEVQCPRFTLQVPEFIY